MNFDHLGLTGLTQMHNLHPLWVHFPVALLPLALIFYLAGVFADRRSLLIAGRWTLVLCVLGAGVSVWTGLRAESSMPHNEKIHALMGTHETLGLLLLGGSILLAAWSFWTEDDKPKGSYLFITVLLLSNLVLLQQADLGGRLVYLEGAGVDPVMKRMQESSHDHGGQSGGHHGGNSEQRSSSNSSGHAQEGKGSSQSPTPSPSPPPDSSSSSESGHDHSSHEH